LELVELDLWRLREPERPLRQTIPTEGIEELAQSIKEHGLLNPITVRDRGGFYEVVAGHRRLLACRRVGLGVVACRVVGGDDLDVAVVGAHENLVRRDMSVSEEARLVAALMSREGWGIAGTARALNRGEGWVRDRVDLLGWPADVVAGITAGRLSMGAAKALMGIENDQSRARLLDHAINNGVSIEVARRWRDLENLGGGTSGGSLNLVGIAAASALAGGKAPCFFCEEHATYGEMTYVWAHRECVIGMDDALRGEGREAAPGAPPGGGAGGAPEDVPGA
jgi:ParB/RepB/Spo0J family partition protein